MHKSEMILLLSLVWVFSCAPAPGPPEPAAGQGERLPIIDMHLHAFSVEDFLPLPSSTCANPTHYLPVFNPHESSRAAFISCPESLLSVSSDAELMKKTLGELERYNMVGVTSGPVEIVRKWKREAPERIISGFTLRTPAQEVGLESLRDMMTSGEVKVLGEVTTQYRGFKPTDPSVEAFFALAEKMDVPVGIHVGLASPGAAYAGDPSYRATLSNPLLLEELLIRHPRLRLYVMHAGWPMLDEMVHLLYSHPQVYVDIAVINWKIPRLEFHRYLQRLVEAGFAKRILFGSDQMVWPQAIGLAIEGIETAEFLTAEQKRDIFYNNAVRFLRLEETEQPRR